MISVCIALYVVRVGDLCSFYVESGVSDLGVAC